MFSSKRNSAFRSFKTIKPPASDYEEQSGDFIELRDFSPPFGSSKFSASSIEPLPSTDSLDSSFCPTPPLRIPTPSPRVPTPLGFYTPRVRVPTPPPRVPTPPPRVPTPPPRFYTPRLQVPTPPPRVPTPPPPLVMPLPAEIPFSPFTFNSSPTTITNPPIGTRLTVVLDLDETIVDGRSYYANSLIYIRSNTIALLQSCARAGIEVIIWSAGIEEYVREVIERLLPIISVSNCCVSNIIYRGDDWLPDAKMPYVKDLSILRNRTLERTVLIDNSPRCIQVESTICRSIIVPDFLQSTVTHYDAFVLLKIADCIKFIYHSVVVGGDSSARCIFDLNQRGYIEESSRYSTTMGQMISFYFVNPF